MKINNNWLIIKPHQLKKLGNMWLPDIANLDMVNFSGTVVDMCESLEYNKLYKNTLFWDTDNELEIGDTVWYNPLCNQELNKMGRGFEKDGELYMFVHYHDIFIATRNSNVVCTNGWILGEPIQGKRSAIILPGGERIWSNHCRIRYVGKPVREYNFGDTSASGKDDPSITLEDEVILIPFAGILLDESRKDIDGGKSFYRFRRRDVLARIIDGKPEAVSDRVIMKPDGSASKIGAIIIPESTETRKDGRWANIVSSGSFCKSKKGERAYYKHSWAMTVHINEVPYEVSREQDVLITAPSVSA